MTSPARDDVDVVVIGGGPAGSCAASSLASAGLRVKLLERVKFPRPHIGESLLAMSMPYLRVLGVADQVSAAGFVRKVGAVFIWGGTGRNLDLGMPHPGYAFQVARDRFDDLLLDAARRNGAEVLTESRVRAPVFDATGRVCGVDVVQGGRVQHVTARYVVDASGLFQFLPRLLGLPMSQEGRRRVALSGYFAGACRLPEPDGDDIITEATSNGWLWFIPLGDQITSVGLVTDEDCVISPERTFRDEMAASRLVRGLVQDATMTSGPRLLRYTNHLVDSPLWRDGYVLVGDAAMFVDPLFSTGVHGALLSASYAAAAMTAVLGGAVPDGEAAAWYDSRIRDHYHRVNETVKILYGVHPGPGKFWRCRDMSALSEAAAETTARRLGAVGARFFSFAQESGAITLPAPLHRRVAEFRTRPRVAALPAEEVPALADEIDRTHDWMWHRGSLTRAVTLAHRRRRTMTVQHPTTSVSGQVLAAVDGVRSAGSILAGLRLDAAQHRTATLLLGTLVEAGVLDRANTNARGPSAGRALAGAVAP